MSPKRLFCMSTWAWLSTSTRRCSTCRRTQGCALSTRLHLTSFTDRAAVRKLCIKRPLNRRFCPCLRATTLRSLRTVRQGRVRLSRWRDSSPKQTLRGESSPGAWKRSLPTFSRRSRTIQSSWCVLATSKFTTRLSPTYLRPSEPPS
jgi:hypothetical protein